MKTGAFINEFAAGREGFVVRVNPNDVYVRMKNAVIRTARLLDSPIEATAESLVFRAGEAGCKNNAVSDYESSHLSRTL